MREVLKMIFVCFRYQRKRRVQVVPTRFILGLRAANADQQQVLRERVLLRFSNL